MITKEETLAKENIYLKFTRLIAPASKSVELNGYFSTQMDSHEPAVQLNLWIKSLIEH